MVVHGIKYDLPDEPTERDVLAAFLKYTRELMEYADLDFEHYCDLLACHRLHQKLTAAR